MLSLLEGFKVISDIMMTKEWENCHTVYNPLFHYHGHGLKPAPIVLSLKEKGRKLLAQASKILTNSILAKEEQVHSNGTLSLWIMSFSSLISKYIS